MAPNWNLSYQSKAHIAGLEWQEKPGFHLCGAASSSDFFGFLQTCNHVTRLCFAAAIECDFDDWLWWISRRIDTLSPTEYCCYYYLECWIWYIPSRMLCCLMRKVLWCLVWFSVKPIRDIGQIYTALRRRKLTSDICGCCYFAISFFASLSKQKQTRKLYSEPNLKGAYITTSCVQLTVVS